MPEKRSDRAAYWYQKAIGYLPCYVKARVHLAEIYLKDGRPGDAEALLMPAVSSGDPEVAWRLADVLAQWGDSQKRTCRWKQRDSVSRVFWKNTCLRSRTMVRVLFRQWRRW